MICQTVGHVGILSFFSHKFCYDIDNWITASWHKCENTQPCVYMPLFSIPQVTPGEGRDFTLPGHTKDQQLLTHTLTTVRSLALSVTRISLVCGWKPEYQEGYIQNPYRITCSLMGSWKPELLYSEVTGQSLAPLYHPPNPPHPLNNHHPHTTQH